MPFLPVYDWVGLDPTRRQEWAINATAIAVSLFFLVDWGVIHPIIWDNDPSSLYWLAKPIWVGVPMVLAAWYARSSFRMSRAASLLVGGLAGVISLQLYYTVVPIPVEGGDAIQIGLVGNLTEGLVVHFGGLALAIVGAYFVYAAFK